MTFRWQLWSWFCGFDCEIEYTKIYRTCVIVKQSKTWYQTTDGETNTNTKLSIVYCKKIPSKLEVAPLYAKCGLDWMGEWIPLRLLWLLEHLAVLTNKPWNPSWTLRGWEFLVGTIGTHTDGEDDCDWAKRAIYGAAEGIHSAWCQPRSQNNRQTNPKVAALLRI